MYDDDVEMALSRHRHRRPSVFVPFLVSALTTVALFFGLREAERRGLLGQAGDTVQVPEVVGMTVEQAREVLAGRGLRLVLQSERSDVRIAAGGIAEQAPLPGSQATSGSAVSAVVSTGALSVPTLTGAAPDEASRKLRALGLVVEEPTHLPHDTVAEGLVIESQPAAGSAVAAGATIKLLVSSGQAGTPVPKVIGLKIKRAREILKDAGFEVGQTKMGYSDYHDGSVVLKQSPEAGQPATPGTKIDLVINEPD